MRWMALMLLPLAVACSSSEDSESSDTGSDTGTVDPSQFTDFDCEPVDDALCADDVGFCGNVKIPTNFEGTTRSLAVALYTTVPPAGPPNATLLEVEAPELTPGSCYPVVVHPMLEQGEYYVWVNLYMEGGGTWVPVNGVDYTGASDAPLNLDGTATDFGSIGLAPASGW